MKKHILAASIAGAFGAATMMSGVAHAQEMVADNGIGHINVVPYFTTQGNNVTQIHVINTDTVNGKAVKVRFRGAEWSDDIYDFTVFLSPHDVFAGAVKVNASGVTAFETTDNSCTHTINVNKAFPTSRISGGAAAGTREGYVEVINMADIPPTYTPSGGSSGANPLFTAIKHVKQSDGSMKPPCRTATTGASFDMFKSDDTSTLKPNVHTSVAGGATIENVSGANVYGTSDTQAGWMTAPTGTLTTWSRVIDVVDVKSYNATATAIDLGTSTRVAFFTQSVAALTPNATMTQDQIFFTKSSTVGVKNAATTTPLTDMYLYDMPDLSTPIAADQLQNMVTALSKAAVISEYVTASDVGGATDIVLTQPLRRYFYTYQSCDTAASCVTEGTDFSRLVSKGGTNSKYIVTGELYTAYEKITKSNRLAMSGLLSNYRPSTLSTSSAVVVYDREERFESASSSIVVSPQEPTVTTLSLKGEVSVVSINLGSSATETKAIGAKLSTSDISQTGYDRGWLTLSTIAKDVTTSITPASWNRLPIIGFTAMQVSGSFKYGNAVPIRWYKDVM